MPGKPIPPSISPAHLAELAQLARQIDANQHEEVASLAKAALQRHRRIKHAIARLKAARQAKQMTLEEVGARSGLGKSNLSRLENDEDPNPRIDTLLRIGDVVGVDLLGVE